MRRDFQIAILLAIAALPAGVAIMAAPYYFEDALKAYAAAFFWGGLVLTAVLIFAAIGIAMRGEATEPKKGHSRRMIALAGMGVCGIGFLGFAAAYFWLSHRSDVVGTQAPTAFSPKPNAPTREQAVEQEEGNLRKTMQERGANLGDLFHYYVDDVLQADKVAMIEGVPYTFPNNDTTPHKLPTVATAFAVTLDPAINTSYISLYIPRFGNEEEAVYLCRQWASEYRRRLDEKLKLWRLETPYPGQPYGWSSDDLKFSGRVYIYHEDTFGSKNIADMTLQYFSHGADVQFRGTAYLDVVRPKSPPTAPPPSPGPPR